MKLKKIKNKSAKEALKEFNRKEVEKYAQLLYGEGDADYILGHEAYVIYVSGDGYQLRGNDIVISYDDDEALDWYLYFKILHLKNPEYFEVKGEKSSVENSFSIEEELKSLPKAVEGAITLKKDGDGVAYLYVNHHVNIYPNDIGGVYLDEDVVSIATASIPIEFIVKYNDEEDAEKVYKALKKFKEHS